jgi:sugar lactone lactonase YvrE
LLFCSDWSEAGGVSIVSPEGQVNRILSNESEFIVRPNGIAVESNGSFLLAHLGAEEGGIFRLHPDGELESVLSEVEGAALEPSNYIHIDQQDRLWITISTRKTPRAKAYTSDVTDGYIVLVDKSGARVVADNLGYTNECLVHPDG